MTIASPTSKIDLLIRTTRLLARMNRTRLDLLQSENLYYQLLTEYFTRIRNAHQEGKLVAAHTVFFPTEILYAMDIVPMHSEMITWLAALLLREQTEMLAKSSELGLAQEICSPHRGLAGMVALNTFPKPDVVLWSNLICDNAAKSGELIMELTGSPGFFLDNPFQNSPSEMTYLVGELEEMVHFLEEKSGRKMDRDKLSEIVARTNQEIELYREINELRKAAPSPMSIRSYLDLLSADYLFPGQPEAIQFLTRRRDELKAMVQQKKGAVRNERFRLMTLFIPPMHLIGYLDKMLEEFGAVSVVEPLFTRWSDGNLDPTKPLDSVAKKSFLIPERRSMYGPFGNQALKDIADASKQFNVTGAVYWAFMGCRHTCATIRMVKETLAEIDVPMLTIDCDLLDPTINSEEETRDKFIQFFELLETL